MSGSEQNPQGPPEPMKSRVLDTGPQYSGGSNTRGVLMQIHLQRFNQALLANVTGLAAIGAWITTGERPLLSLAACTIACIFSLHVSRI